MILGLGQTGKTCWFYSSLNLLLLSDNGLKILYDKLQKVYNSWGPVQKKYFEANINAPCPLRSVLRTSPIYFWKFLDQYLCFIGGPGRLNRKTGRSPRLMRNIGWTNAALRESKGQNVGGFPSKELPKILRHIGFKTYDFKATLWSRLAYWFRERKPFMILNYRQLEDLPLERVGYELTGAIVYAASANGKNAHVWTCVIRNGKGYIFDSAVPDKLWPCEWWDQMKIMNFFKKSSLLNNRPYFRLDLVSSLYFDLVMYTRKEFTNKIAPACRRVYRPLNPNLNPNLNNNIFNMTGNDPNIGQKVNNMNIPPALKAELKGYEGRRSNVTAEMYNKIVRNSKNQNAALNALSNLEMQGWRVRRNGPLYIKFMKNIRKSNKNLIAKETYNNILSTATSRGNAVANLRALMNAGYVLNINGPNYKNFEAAINRKFPIKNGAASGSGARKN